MQGRRHRLLLVLLVGTLGLIVAWAATHTPLGHRLLVKLRGSTTVEQRLDQFGARARRQWTRNVNAADGRYPPTKITLVAIKDDRVLHVYCDGLFVRTIRVLGQSGQLGPKRVSGDEQVPEGVYGIESLNPDSRFHVSLRIDYPNATDRDHAAEGVDLGGDIMIHGGSASIGCLAVGDEAAEDLFVLAHDVGLENVSVLLCPVDFRTAQQPASDALEAAKYDELRRALAGLPPPRRTGSESNE